MSTRAQLGADYKKTLDCNRATRGRFGFLVVPPLRYLVVDERGDLNASTRCSDAATALYSVACPLMFIGKSTDRDYVVMPLEGRWWATDMESFTSRRDDLVVPRFPDRFVLPQ